MTYEAFEEQISAYLDDELNLVAKEEMERKAAECDACWALLKDMIALRERLKGLPQAQPSAGFNFALRSHLLMEVAKENQIGHRVRQVMFGSAMRTITTLAAAVVIGLGLAGVVQDDTVPLVQTVVEDAEFPLMPAQPVTILEHRGALEQLSQHSYSLDGRLIQNRQDSGRVDSILNKQPPWLQNQNVKQVPVSF